MNMRKFHKYFESKEIFLTKKIANSSSNTEYTDINGDSIFAPGELDILWEDICFIAGDEDTLPVIYTHGEYYSGNTVSLQTAYEGKIHGLADALDVVNVIINNEEVVSYALSYHDECISNKQNKLSYTSYINIANNILMVTYTTLATAYDTKVDGLATALDTANELVKVENTIAVSLNNHESRLNIIEDTNIVDGNFKLGDTIYLSCAYVNGDTIVCDKHVTYNEETKTIIVNS